MNRGNQILTGLLAAQALVLVGMSLADDDRMVVESKRLFPQLEPDQVSKVEIFGPPGDAQEQIVLARSGNDWVIDTADGYPAKTEKVEELLETLTGLRSTTTVVTSAKYHEKLKVSEDAYNRRVRLTVDGEPTELLLGTSPSFKNTHIRVAGSDEVYLVPELSTGDVAERPWNWVERAYLNLDEDEVWSVEVENAQGTFRLERDPVSDAWAAVGVEGELDDSTVNDLVRKARSINLEAPVGKTVAPEHGLEAPKATVRLVVGTSTVSGSPPPSTESKTIRIGAKVDGQSRYYLQSSDSEYVVQVAEYAVKPLLEKGRDDLLAKDD